MQRPTASSPPPVAALYVRRHTHYRQVHGVELWDAERDARTYPGPWPVVAHPPCVRWGRYAHYAGVAYQDGGCGAAAVAAVRRWGGVLEHPAHSRLWLACYMPPPGCSDLWGGRTLAIEQGDWGHAAAKPTWLYVVGTGHQLIPPPGLRRLDQKPVESLSREAREKTPPALCHALVALARGAYGSLPLAAREAQTQQKRSIGCGRSAHGPASGMRSGVASAAKGRSIGRIKTGSATR